MIYDAGWLAGFLGVPLVDTHPDRTVGWYAGSHASLTFSLPTMMGIDWRRELRHQVDHSEAFA